MKYTIAVIGASLLGLSFASAADCGKCDKAGEKASCDKGKCEESCEAKLEVAFSKHDADKDGKLTLVEFKSLVKAMKAECEEECEDGKCDKAVKMEKPKTAAVSK